jgi:hypothetical protein
MELNIRILAAALTGLLLNISTVANAQTEARSYAVMSLIGDVIHVDTVRSAVGTRAPGESHHVLDIPDTVFDNAALVAANASIKQAQPAAKVVLMMTQDVELYKAQNAMFDRPEDNKANRDYLIGLLKDRGVSHLILVTKQREHAYFKLDNGSTGTGQLEGLGFYIDDTSRLLDTASSESGRGMLGPFAYVKIRLLDAATLALVAEAKASKSSILIRPSAESSAMDMWTTMASAEKIKCIDELLGEAVAEAIAPLLNMRRTDNRETIEFRE